MIKMIKMNYYSTTITTTIVQNNFETIATHGHSCICGDGGHVTNNVQVVTVNSHSESHNPPSTHLSPPTCQTSQGVKFKPRSTLGQWSVSGTSLFGHRVEV